MKVRVLGCSGGIGGRHLRTTSFLVDHDVLIDGGTGVGDLSLAELAVIDHVFVTHSHLDHIACIPLLVDTVGDMRNRPLTLYATEATLQILKNHVFNWSIWPDFSEIPGVENPFLRYQSISVGDTVTIGPRRITTLPANHTVPAVGYQLDSGAASLVFTGDTTTCDELWKAVEQDPQFALSGHRDSVFQPGEEAGDRVEAPLPEYAGGGTGKTAAQPGGFRHPPQARTDRADDAGARGEHR